MTYPFLGRRERKPSTEIRGAGLIVEIQISRKIVKHNYSSYERKRIQATVSSHETDKSK